MKSIIEKHESRRKLETLVENKTTYHSEYSELNIYETHKTAHQVSLTFDFPIIASMITGKKVMHLEGLPSFDFLPGESVVMPASKEMVIDFPIAQREDPTRCLALGIDAEKIEDVVYRFNEKVQIENENGDWNLEKASCHLTHNYEVNQLLNRLIDTFIENSKSKDLLLDLMIQELIVRLLQTKARHYFLSDSQNLMADTRIAFVIRYIKEHLTEKNITIDLLAQKAQMSPSHFFRQFKNTLGLSPIEYINSEKIKFAKKLMKSNKSLFISEVAYKAGFNNVSYFNRQFKKLEMITPQQFKKSLG